MDKMNPSRSTPPLSKQHNGPLSHKTTPVEKSNVTNQNNSSKAPEVDKGKQKISEDSFEEQLEKIRLDSLKIKNNSLIGFIFGDPIEIKIVISKLLGSWRLLQRQVQIYERGFGWFEIVFTDPSTLKRVWEGRPYHVIGQLLLLRKWRVDFISEFEETNTLDLWIRIFNLPSTLACNSGAKLIVEENKVGKFLKFDHSSGGFFARVCINLDITKNIPGDVKISTKPDEPPLNIWFEDFPQGCGNCGNPTHVFNSCPLRKFVPKTVSITITKRATTSPQNTNPSKSNPPTNNVPEAWTSASKSHKKKQPADVKTPHGVKPYLSETSGISITFKEQRGTGYSEKKDVAEKSNITGNQSTKKDDKAAHDDSNKSTQMQGCMDCQQESSSPTNLPKKQGDINEALKKIEELMETDDLLGEELEVAQKKEAAQEKGKAQLQGSRKSYAEVVAKKTPALYQRKSTVAPSKSNSDSLKRKEKEDEGDDTASSVLKRTKPKVSHA